ncbi:MAG: ATP-binding protein [Omnitrophica WOR_2 bacterium]
MSIKSKLTLGLGFLFGLIVLLSIFGILQVQSLSRASNNILAENYNSLEYSRNMLKELDKLGETEESVRNFRQYLLKQKNNITEIGEDELTDSLSAHFARVINNPSELNAKRILSDDINHVMHLNMTAISEKSLAAKKKANNAIILLSAAGFVCMLLSFFLLIKLPGIISKPVKELTESIRQITQKNYSHRIHLDNYDSYEFKELVLSFNSMARELDEYTKSNLARLMMAIKRMEALIEKMNEPVIGLDESGVIIFANNSARNITGLEKDQLIGKNATDLALTNDLIRTLMRDIYNPNEGSKNEPLKIYANGKESYFEIEVLNITLDSLEQDKKLISHVLLLRNVTFYKELDFAKTNFIANISHEFKTPISAIKLSLQLLENTKVGQLNNEQKKLIKSIKDDSERLLKITSELLNMTQVESGNIQLNIVQANLKDILDYAIRANTLQAKRKNLSIDIECSDQLPRVLADNEKTAWVLTNLISNAIRYSYNNSHIFVSVTPEHDSIRISVKDTGQGISPEFKDKIFNRYFRGPDSKKEGTGLGLAISKEFIEAQGGKITVESEVGKGSTFSFTLSPVPAKIF